MRKRGGRLLPSTRRALIVLPLWTACLLWMWSWWFNTGRVGFLALFIPLTLALFYEFAMLPSIFLYFLFRAKYPARRVAPKGKKVALITLCVPSKESIDIIEGQLRAMAEVKYPHDSWVLDEGNDPEVKRLAKKLGVKYFSRKGIEKYNQPDAPFKAKTKAGNVNAWLEHSKRMGYEYFVQLDIDHLPKQNYLDKTLGYFRDEKVAWVQAPSVYKNHQSWTARGSSEQELVLQGPLQMGFYGHSETPFIIGSHCTYRTKAVREIGGFQPTRAEDHLDTVALSSAGYKGVFLPEIIAEGDGPETLNTYLGQQFAWAYSMFQVLTKHSPKMLRKMPWRKRLQFLFAQTWYPFWSLSYFTTFMVPIVALVLNVDVAHMARYDFFEHFVPLFACSFLVWWAAKPVMQPAGVGLTWRGMLLHVVRWPIILKAIFSALFQIKKPYMITPKGKAQGVPILQTYRPFLFLGLLSTSAVLYATLAYHKAAIASQIVFALTNAIFMLTICLADLNIHMREAAVTVSNFSRAWLKPVIASSLLCVMLVGSALGSPLVRVPLASAFTPNPVAKQKPLSQMSLAELEQTISELPATNQSTPEVGIYAPATSVPSSAPYIRHFFADWRKPHYIAEQIALTEERGQTPLITIEPRGDINGARLLSDIAAGNYDDRLQPIAEVLAASNKPVYIRFAHEMELADLYPWGNQSPELYKAAYRHVVDYVRDNGGDNAKWVWSPAGNYGAESYYPGDAYVDTIGTTVLYDQYWYGASQPSFGDLIESRQHMFSFGKPVWIVEFGAGNAYPEFQAELIRQAVTSYKSYGFSALLYLDIADSNINGPDYRLHDLTVLGPIFTPHKVIPGSAKQVTIQQQPQPASGPQRHNLPGPLDDILPILVTSKN
jgi:cellulose synthase (UDP-forming)